MKTRNSLLIGALLALPAASASAQTTYTTNAQFDGGVLNSVNHDIANQLQLDSSSETLPYMYVAQTNEGIVLKIDTRNGKQVARYATTYLASCPTCTPNANQWAPSRTTVELNGDLWVANRGFGIVAGVTLIAQDPIRCVDRNGNLQIDTSNDANNDGFINESDPAEFFGQNDECLIKTIQVGPADAVLRGLALDGDGNLWVGAYNARKVYEIDTATNTILRTFDMPNNPYGLAIQGDYVHAASPGNYVARINQTTGDIQWMGGVSSCFSNYGIVVNSSGVVWTGNYESGLNSHDFSTCPATGLCPVSCTRHDVGGHVHYGVTIDGDGQIWASSNYQGWVDKYSAAGVLLGSVATGDTPHGIAIAHDGAPWAAGYFAAVRVEPGLVGAAPVSAVRYDTGVPGAPFGRFNYTYSDFTGFLLRNLTQRVGTWTSTTDGGAAGTDWASVSWNNEPQGSTPAGTTITAQCRAADSIAGLALVAYAPVTNGGSLAGVLGRYIQCEFTLRIIDTNSTTSPVLSDVTITPRQPACSGPCDDGNSCTDNDHCVAGVCTGTYRWDLYACEFHELVVEMAFEEAAGSTATDSSGHDQHGTISGGVTREAGQAGHGNALCFDGVDGLVTIASHPKLDLWNELTIEANVKPASLSGWRSVLLRELNGSDLAYGLYASNATGKPEAVIHNTNDQHAANGVGLTVGAWTHLAATYNGSSLKFYVNGVLKKTKATTGPIGTSTRALYLGGNSLWGEFFEGCIDDVRVYHKVLSATEIAADAATAVTP